jgi:hypothetical protein
MTTIRALIAIGSVIISGASGCAQPGVISISRVMGTGGAPASGAAAGVGAVMAPPATASSGGSTAQPPVATGSGGSSAAGSSAGGSSAGGSSAGGSSAGGSSAAGSSGGAGAADAMATGGAGSAAGAGGSTSPPPKCPSGYDCIDLSAVGAEATDGKGNPVTFSCGMGGLMDCNEADPLTTCAPLTQPFCAHISVAGMDLVSCGQHCTP